ncbi:transposase [Streptosporangium amethystogenes]|uniref:transposase n=1 Tax=Streptosporangium amethystogenes TaxID=2002 RepID=UPI0009FC7C20|nr:transposase [Streptosporangium amethystogenes]
MGAREATCPDGKHSIHWRHRAHMAGDGAAIGFAATDCQPCPLRIHCTKGIAGRQIVIPSRRLYDIQRANRADQTDPRWRRRYNLCAGVESTISEAVRAHGLRRCRYIGLAKTRLQHVLIACAMNAARIADWTERDNHPARERSPSSFKILCKARAAS